MLPPPAAAVPELAFNVELVGSATDVSVATSNFDGTRVLFVRWSDRSAIWSVEPSSGRVERTVQLNGTVDAIELAESGDVYVSGTIGGTHGLFRIRADGKPEILSSQSPAASELALSPDGKWVAFIRRRNDPPENDLVIRSTVDDAERVVYVSPGLFALNNPTWSPAGTSIVMASRGRVVELDLVSLVEKELVQARWKGAPRAQIASDGSFLLIRGFRTGSVFEIGKWRRGDAGPAALAREDHASFFPVKATRQPNRFFGRRHQQPAHLWIGSFEASGRMHIPGPEAATGTVSFTRDGSVLYSCRVGGVTQVCEMGEGWLAPRQLTKEDSDSYSPREAPNGTFIIVRHDGDLWRLDRSTLALSRLTTGGAAPTFAISPDSRTVAYTSHGSGVDPAGIYLMPAGGGSHRMLTHDHTNDLAFTSDSEWLLYSKWLPDGIIQRANVKTGQIDSLGIHGSSFSLSPDGRILAIGPGGRTNTPALLLDLQTWQTSKTAPLPHGYQYTAGVAWADHGRSLLFVVHDGGLSNIWGMHLADGSIRPVTTLKEHSIFSYAVSADGSRLAFTRGRNVSQAVFLTIE